MDIKKAMEDVVAKLKSDEALQKQFLSDPAGALKTLTGIDIPTDQIDAVITVVKPNSPPTTWATPSRAWATCSRNQESSPAVFTAGLRSFVDEFYCPL